MSGRRGRERRDLRPWRGRSGLRAGRKDCRRVEDYWDRHERRSLASRSGSEVDRHCLRISGHCRRRHLEPLGCPGIHMGHPVIAGWCNAGVDQVSSRSRERSVARTSSIPRITRSPSSRCDEPRSVLRERTNRGELFSTEVYIATKVFVRSVWSIDFFIKRKFTVSFMDEGCCNAIQKRSCACKYRKHL